MEIRSTVVPQDIEDPSFPAQSHYSKEQLEPVDIGRKRHYIPRRGSGAATQMSVQDGAWYLNACHSHDLTCSNNPVGWHHCMFFAAGRAHWIGQILFRVQLHRLIYCDKSKSISEPTSTFA